MNKGREMPDRLVFPKGGQKAFLLAAREKLGYRSWTEMSRDFDFHRRSLSDWAQEKWRISEKAARAISQKSKISIPAKAKRLTWKEHVGFAGKIGGKAVVKKYGNLINFVGEKQRKRKWYEWWEKEGRYQHPIVQPKSFNKAVKSSQLAEFVGVVLGDGGVTNRQIAITLNREDDFEYISYVRQLIESLFDVVPGQHSDKKSKADVITISRKELVRYCVEELGVKVGNKVKQQVEIPEWINGNSRYVQKCVRGLVDTDGSVFTHRYKVNGKEYRYKKLSFSNRSKPLLDSVYDLLNSIGTRARYAGNHEVRLDSIKDMERYFAVIGTSNPKHLKRYQE